MVLTRLGKRGRSAHAIALWALLAALVCAPPARAQVPEEELDAAPREDGQGRRPAAAGRVVEHFDFEEKNPDDQERFNPERIPRNWYLAQDDPPRRQRPEFPNYNDASFDDHVAHEGAWSVRLDTRGGSTCLRAYSGALPVFPAADYLVTAYVRTGAVRWARAMVEARFTDQSGRAIPGSSFRSPPILSPDAWTPVRIELPGRFAGAVGIEIDLLLVQPSQYEPVSLLGRHAVTNQDLGASAWFDDVSVVQQPRVELTTTAPGNIFDAKTQPTIRVDVRDLTGEGLVTNLTLRDIDGNIVDTDRKHLPAGGAQFAWKPTLPRFGWYQAELTIEGKASAEIGATSTALVWSPAADLSPRPPGHLATDDVTRPFSLHIDRLPPSLYRLVPDLLTQMNAGSVTLPLPDEPGAMEEYRRGLDGALAAGADVTIAVTRLMRDLASERRIDADDPLALLGQDESLTARALGGLLDIYGQRVTRWQFNGIGTESPLLHADLAQRLISFRTLMSKSVPGPQVTLGWRAQWPVPQIPAPRDGATMVVDALTLSIPSSFPPESTSVMSKLWSLGDRHGPTPTLVIEAPDAEFPKRAQVTEILQRAVACWAALDPLRDTTGGAKIPRLALHEPWTITPGTNPSLSPEPALAAWMVMTQHLGNRRVAGEMTLGTGGVRCYLLTPAGARSSSGSGAGGALVAWNESSPPEQANIHAYLGPGPLTIVDAMGNTTTLSVPDEQGLYTIPLSDEPVFVEGVDAELVRFNAGVRVEPDFAPSVAAVHEHELVLFNPWPVRITGEARFERPESRAGRDWHFTPTTPVAFSIGPGQTARVPFSFSFGPGEEAGEKKLGVVVRVMAERPYPPMRLAARINIGLQDFSVNVSAQPSPGPGGPDVVMTTVISNTGKNARTLQIQAQAPNMPEQQQTISNLMPGENAVRRFLFRGGAGELSGKRVKATVADVDSAERLNKYALVP